MNRTSHLDKTINISEYPNALAHLRAYPQSKTIEVLGTFRSNEDMAARKKSNKGKNEDVIKPSHQSSTLETMWKFMGMGKIDISYACVGYTFDGRPVLNYAEFTDLLINYGFDINDVLAFIDDFVECAKSDEKGPIVMTTVNSSRIMTEIEPLVDRGK